MLSDQHWTTALADLPHPVLQVRAIGTTQQYRVLCIVYHVPCTVSWLDTTD
jgi:hypothetical protein